jgi:hypothetical protein
MQVISSNLQGDQSLRKFWRKFPAIFVFQYQCSPMSSSESIEHQFNMAVRYQRHARNVITVLLLDEVGLAEHSPDMPLKVLHKIMVQPKVSIVGISNWVLDPAKMNRAICLQRPTPSQEDIHLTGQRIIIAPTVHVALESDGGGASTAASLQRTTSAGRRLAPWLAPLAQAYHQIYTEQDGRDFVGMRDYYQLLKFLRYHLSERGSGYALDAELLTFAICRNFGGKTELLARAVAAFHAGCFGAHEPGVALHIPQPSVRSLIQANLEDTTARHLMVLTSNGAALPLMFGCGLLSQQNTTILHGSQFQEDMNELHLVQQINEVKLAMATGNTICLVNHDNIYEALYDVLNQRYVTKNDVTTGVAKRMLRLAIGSRSQLCAVENSFKLIVIVEQGNLF